MSRNSQPPQVRVDFVPPGAAERVTSLWVTIDEATEPGRALVRLLHEYPADEFRPGPGWRLVRRGNVVYTVDEAREGNVLACTRTF